MKKSNMIIEEITNVMYEAKEMCGELTEEYKNKIDELNEKLREAYKEEIEGEWVI